MWTAHLLARPQPPERQAVLTGAFGRLASRFSGLEWTLDAFDAAQHDDHGDAMPWTSWFLAELPDEEAHFIPTDSKLLFATLLMCARFIEPERPASLTPRAWFVWRDADIRTVLEQLKTERAHWQPVLGVPDSFVHSDQLSADPELGWRQRIDRLGTLLDLGRRAQQEDERGRIRTTALDPERIQDLRRETLREAGVSRVLRDTVAVQGRIVRLNDRPEDHEGLVSHNWAPRSFFTIDSQVVGLDLMARDLAQPARIAEQQQLIAALSEATPAGGQAGDLQSSLVRVIHEMRDEGMKPSLIVLPLNWRLQRELGLDRQGALPVDHPLVPPAHRRTFCGVFDDVPALDLVRVSKDRFWVLDLVQAIQFEEWPSDEDSGLRFELRSFDDELSAASFLADHPEAAAPEKTREDALLEIRDRVLISLHLCWRILLGEPRAARSVAIPANLQRQD